MQSKSRCFLESVGVGVPILFIHGFPLDRSLWRSQVQPVSEVHRFISVDLPGFGDAESATANDLQSIAQMADEISLALHDAGVDRPAIVVGLSMGGYIALEFWRRHRKWVQGLVLVNTKALADNPNAVEARKTMAATAMARGTQEAVEPMVQKLLSSTSRTLPQLVEWLKQTMFAVPASTIEMAQLAMASRDDFTAKLHQIDVPTLVVAGEEDAIIPSDVMKAMADGIPNAQFFQVASAAHLVPIEQPNVFNELLFEFLSSIVKDDKDTN